MTKTEIAKDFVKKCYENVKQGQQPPNKKTIEEALQKAYPNVFLTFKSAENAVIYATNGRKKPSIPVTLLPQEKAASFIAPVTDKKTEQDLKDYIDELEEALSLKRNSNPEIFDIIPVSEEGGGKSKSVAVAMFSDWHVDEVVDKESVMGLNEFNPEIADKRIKNLFINLDKLVSHAQRSYHIDELVIGLIGDMASGYIHDELMQTNSMSPLEGIRFAKSHILSGFKYLQENTNVSKIKVVCVIGNHTRTTKKNQYSNASRVNNEYEMYVDIAEFCKLMGMDKFEFIIPKSEMAVITIFGHRILLTHGSHLTYNSGIGGLVVPVMRWFSRIAKVFNVEMAWLGHFHQSIFTKNIIINPSLIGYSAFAMGKGFEKEEPTQTMLIWNEKRGITQYTPIFLD
jgi:predicted phosphodiesterase